MMITVSVKDLEKMVNELSADKVEYVEIFILEPDELDGEVIPATLHFEAYDGAGATVAYDEIEGIEVDPFYKEKD